MPESKEWDEFLRQQIMIAEAILTRKEMEDEQWERLFDEYRQERETRRGGVLE